MILGKIAKAVLKLIMPDVIEHLMKVFKMDKLLSYMELPNDADRGVMKLQDEVDALKSIVTDMSKDIHPPVIDRKEVDQLKDNVNNLMKLIKNTKKLRSL